MFQPRRLFVIFLVVVILCLRPALHAGPTVIRDIRIADTGLTPALGRGYSIGTNTFQSLCMKEVEITTPSYNFFYTFEQLERDGTRKSDTTVTRVSSEQASGFFSIFGGKDDSTTSETTNTQTETKTHSHRILVTLLVDTYYASVNEARSAMSDSARELLEKKDIPGFFDSCGIYYVRSLGRFSKFVSVFEYKSVDEKRDVIFERQLESKVKSWWLSDEKTTNESTSGSNSSTSSSKELKITTAAWGVGKNDDASLISYDLETFKAAITEAFKSTQDPNVGLVSTMEVVPWVENTEFQQAIGLETKTVVQSNIQANEEGGVELARKNKEVPVYRRKRILNLNGEFIAELDRVARAKLNIYYKAKLCRDQIRLDYTDGSDLRGEFQNKRLLNNRTRERKPLQEVWTQTLSEDKIQELFDDYDKFLYGGGEYGGGSLECVEDLVRRGIFLERYQNIDSCKTIVTKLTAVQAKDADEYCMPYLVN